MLKELVSIFLIFMQEQTNYIYRPSVTRLLNQWGFVERFLDRRGWNLLFSEKTAKTSKVLETRKLPLHFPIVHLPDLFESWGWMWKCSWHSSSLTMPFLWLFTQKQFIFHEVCPIGLKSIWFRATWIMYWDLQAQRVPTSPTSPFYSSHSQLEVKEGILT